MKPQKHNIKRITTLLEQLDWAFETNNFTRTLVEVEQQPEDQPDLVAMVIPDMTYKELTVKIYPYFWELGLEKQRAALLHEMVHVITHDLKMIADGLLNGEFHTLKEIKEVNEKATSSITHLLDSLLQGYLTYLRRSYKDYVKTKLKKKKKLKP